VLFKFIFIHSVKIILRYEKSKLGYSGELDEDKEIGRLMPTDEQFLDHVMADLEEKNNTTSASVARNMEKCKKLQELGRLHHRAEGTTRVRHKGFTQLCIIREKEENWKEVLQLAEQAKAEGWYGDWDKRIEKAKKKMGQAKQ
jgi:hypothetical protein